jgi:hypothetical protein
MGSQRVAAEREDLPYHKLVDDALGPDTKRPPESAKSPAASEPGFTSWHGPSMLLLVLLGTFLNMEVRPQGYHKVVLDHMPVRPFIDGLSDS